MSILGGPETLRPRVSRGLALVMSAVLLATPACGDDDDGGGGEAKTVSVRVAGNAKNLTLEGVPERLEAGVVRTDLANSTQLPTDLQIVRVDADQTAEQVLKEVLDAPEGTPIPGWAHGAGGVGPTPPGGSGTATQELGEGTYHLFAEVQTEDGGGKPATATLRVEGGDGGGELPSAEATIEAVDYGFEVEGLRSGRNTVEFTNTGKELHHALALPYAPGATEEEVRKALTSEEEPSGPPPVDFENAQGTTVIDGGAKLVTELELKKGKYAFVCFIPDRAGGPPHVAKGMLREVTVE